MLSGMPLSRRTVLAVCSDTSDGRETHAQFVLRAEDLATLAVGPEGGDGWVEFWLEAAPPPRSAAVRLRRAEAARAFALSDIDGNGALSEPEWVSDCASKQLCTIGASNACAHVLPWGLPQGSLTRASGSASSPSSATSRSSPPSARRWNLRSQACLERPYCHCD